MAEKNNGFTFKQFHVKHDRCAMKVGTDGILLGAWADIAQADSILDLGTGTGLIALMLAQRTRAEVQISAVELDADAFTQAQENVQASPWFEKIKLYHQDIKQFSQQCGQKFDLIVANPPYFTQGVQCASQARNLARYTNEKTHSDWLDIAFNCLAPQGKIQFILLFEAGKTLQKPTALYCIECCEVVTKQGKKPQLVLLTFSPTEQPCKESQFLIYDEHNRYHSDFIHLTKAFYLKF